MLTKPLGGLYTITVDGIGIYYGESDNIPRRWARHRRQLNNGRHHNIKLRRAYRDLGPKAFHFAVIAQSKELTDNKELRKSMETTLILADKHNLNTAKSESESVSVESLPSKDIYRNRIVYLERVPRSTLARVRAETKTGTLLGIEAVDGKFRMGRFQTDANCKLTRMKI